MTDCCRVCERCRRKIRRNPVRSLRPGFCAASCPSRRSPAKTDRCSSASSSVSSSVSSSELGAPRTSSGVPTNIDDARAKRPFGAMSQAQGRLVIPLTGRAAGCKPSPAETTLRRGRRSVLIPPPRRQLGTDFPGHQGLQGLDDRTGDDDLVDATCCAGRQGAQGAQGAKLRVGRRGIRGDGRRRGPVVAMHMPRRRRPRARSTPVSEAPPRVSEFRPSHSPRGAALPRLAPAVPRRPGTVLARLPGWRSFAPPPHPAPRSAGP